MKECWELNMPTRWWEPGWEDYEAEERELTPEEVAEMDELPFE